MLIKSESIIIIFFLRTLCLLLFFSFKITNNIFLFTQKGLILLLKFCYGHWKLFTQFEESFSFSIPTSSCYRSSINKVIISKSFCFDWLFSFCFKYPFIKLLFMKSSIPWIYLLIAFNQIIISLLKFGLLFLIFTGKINSCSILYLNVRV